MAAMAGSERDWRGDLERWLDPFLRALKHPARRAMCPAYVAGLIGLGDRKSIQPMAARTEGIGYDRLHHFIGAAAWDEAPLGEALCAEANRLVGGRHAVLVVDDTGLPKKGDHSVGVAPQYASSLGKTANCQTLVSLTLARGEVPVAIGLRLFLPERWTGDPERLARAGVPEELRAALTKPEIALAEVDRVRAAGVRFGTVLADAGYGISAAFRQGLSARGLVWAVGVPRILKVYPADVALLDPPAGAKARRRPEPDQVSASAEAMLAPATWQRISWRRGTKGRLAAHFAALRVRVADGPAQQVRGRPAQHLPGEEVWVVGERRASGETKYYLSNLPATARLVTLAVAIKARWVCEQAHQQMKEELGFDHFEGRSWTGLHRHTLMVMMAFAFLQARRLAGAEQKKGAAVASPRRSPACPRSARRSSPTSAIHRRRGARIATRPLQAYLNANLPK